MLGTCGVGFRKLQGHGLYLFVVLSGVDSMVSKLSELCPAVAFLTASEIRIGFFETSLQHVASRGQWHLTSFRV